MGVNWCSERKSALSRFYHTEELEELDENTNPPLNVRKEDEISVENRHRRPEPAILDQEDKMSETRTSDVAPISAKNEHLQARDCSGRTSSTDAENMLELERSNTDWLVGLTQNE